MYAFKYNQPTVTQNYARDERSPWEKIQDSNEESLRRQRRRREERKQKKLGNTGQRPIQDDGKDLFPRRDKQVPPQTGFNGTVGLCIDGTPYWINISYDDSKGPYAVTGDADFPIEAP